MPAIGVSCAGKLSLFVLAVVAASAQIYPPGGYPPGGYPPGGYPPGGYPGGGNPRYPGGAGIPIPTRGGKTQPGASTKGQPLPNFRGKLKQMDAKTISLALDDDRVLDFKRDAKTKFFKGGDEIKDPKFNPGDQLSIEGPEDNTGYMTAVNVYWEKGAAATGTATADSKTKSDKVPDAWADAPSQQHGTETAPPPAKHDSDDPGPPTLQRGKAADPSREKSAPIPDHPPVLTAQNAQTTDRPTLAATNGQPPERLPQFTPKEDGNDAISGSLQHQDDLIRKAADTALDFTGTLPNYVCQELMSRYQSETRPANWQALDVVGTEVVYENGKEDYRKITLNGRPINKKIEDMGGAWSTGEFGTILIDLFSPATAAEFHYRKDSRMAGILTKEYDYTVTHANSHWSIHMGSQSYDPGYTGTVWIDPASARVMRIEMSARAFPSDFATDDVESATDYEYVRLGDAKQYLLPVHAETLSCQRGTNDCSRNVIDFRNYRKYTGESTITFGDPKK